MLQKKIENKLKIIFNPVYLKINNNHIKNHFKIIIVSDHFIGQNFITRHRSIYSILNKELIKNIHALSLYTYTIKEWKKLKYTTPIIPNCYNVNN
ncbi:BolA/IbaG family iron-sulfur metabolism protein [Enterobacteriaceae endosymbiont of Plateumaris rustica]|uniref:BolA/IbaG family iron-sulfur metabolism protein n=1 Tax=Enterobacteriaceae endosymbiont of Plateumaris rustica TaxID=2675796 RepID=UPI001448DD4C|nr:BolA/IbaG family iron-sulfur metabolism protein [Enterobacteriaceae endosymbiont of Plateumaris rustica]QJC29072.1 BolA/IbaG family iron-sulfur metabolism protein [Enterobacteriaceae endosymbiont of Plateumaris rustica]